jgi:hypothetical protein
MHDKIEEKLSAGEVDETRMGWSLTTILKDLVEGNNSKIESRESTDKLSQMEIELGDIAKNVKKNISDIFERGERFGVLVSKSESLKTHVSYTFFMRVIE